MTKTDHSLETLLTQAGRWIDPGNPGLAGRDLTPMGKITDIMMP